MHANIRFLRYAASSQGEARAALRRESPACAVAALRARVLPRFAAAEDAGRLAEVMSFHAITEEAEIGDSDVERIHDAFEPLTARVAADHATLVPGVVEVAEELRRRGLRIGSTTGTPAG